MAGGAAVWGLEELVTVVRGPGCWSLCVGLAAPQSERRAFWIEFSMISRVAKVIVGWLGWTIVFL